MGFCKSVKLEKSNEKIKKEIDIIDQVKIIVDEDLNAIYEGITSQYDIKILEKKINYYKKFIIYFSDKI